MLRLWRLLSLLFTALALTMTSAHVLELPQKMQYDAEFYAAVNTSLYKYFAIIGGSYAIGAILSLGILTLILRNHRRSFRWTLAAFMFFVLWFVSWLAIVQPVNNQIAQALQSSADSVPALYMTLRERWEYGHAIGFGLQLLGLMALIISVLKDTPDHVRSDYY
ncbi:MAG: DUF1772 domain-containing protein [Acidobacteriota bacterium]